MRTIKPGRQFDRDYRRERKGRHGPRLDELLRPIFDALTAEQPLAERYRDHAMTGNWRGHRDCHVRPDLVLIYRFASTDLIELVRLGSHSDLRL